MLRLVAAALLLSLLLAATPALAQTPTPTDTPTPVPTAYVEVVELETGHVAYIEYIVTAGDILIALGIIGIGLLDLERQAERS